jgi:RNase H-like domain found in reverse transcriptase
MGTADTPGVLGAILRQVDQDGKFYAILFASRQLIDHKKYYCPFLLEAATTVWGMDHFEEYLKGKKSFSSQTTKLWKNICTVRQ